MKTATGTVEKAEFTSGGLGNQWTWIDGVRYMTFWNALTMDWQVGDRVTFKSGHKRVYSNLPPVLQAWDIHKVTE